MAPREVIVPYLYTHDVSWNCLCSSCCTRLQELLQDGNVYDVIQVLPKDDEYHIVSKTVFEDLVKAQINYIHTTSEDDQLLSLRELFQIWLSNSQHLRKESKNWNLMRREVQQWQQTSNSIIQALISYGLLNI